MVAALARGGVGVGGVGVGMGDGVVDGGTVVRCCFFKGPGHWSAYPLREQSAAPAGSSGQQRGAPASVLRCLLLKHN